MSKQKKYQRSLILPCLRRMEKEKMRHLVITPSGRESVLKGWPAARQVWEGDEQCDSDTRTTLKTLV